MNIRLLFYVLGSFLVSLSAGGQVAKTANDWITVIAGSLANALLTAFAKLDGSSQPPSGNALRVGILIGSLLILSGCRSMPPIKARVCYIDPRTHSSVCVGRDAGGITIDGAFGGKSIVPVL